MERPWEADVRPDQEAARRLVEGQFPDLAPARLEALGFGWDNAAWLVNGAWVFRFPRRRIAAELVENEVRLLPAIAPRVPLAVPVPARIGTPAGGYPYPFAGYRLLAGTAACSATLTEAQRADLAGPLARFLRALHGIPPPPGTPPDRIGRMDLPARARQSRERLAVLAGAGVDAVWVAARLEALASTLPWSGPPRLVHGDLYARHVLVDAAGRPCAVIDWGDVHAGDPAVDLAIAFLLLPADAHPAFRAAYGEVDADTWARARFRALHHSVALLTYALDRGEAALEAAARRGLRGALGG